MDGKWMDRWLAGWMCFIVPITEADNITTIINGKMFYVIRKVIINVFLDWAHISSALKLFLNSKLMLFDVI